MKVGLIITCYERPELLRQCLDSLSRADLSQLSEVMIVDDCSTDPNVMKVILEHKLPITCTLHTHAFNTGIKHSLIDGYNLSFHFGCDIAINLDADSLVKQNFITELLRLKQQHPGKIISGFNCNSPANPILSEHEGYVLRKHCNGINMCINRDEYDKIIKPALLGSGNWDYSATHDNPFVIARPSLVQHIGCNDSTMGHVQGDVACDFKLLTLPQVSLFGIDAHDPEGIRRAADICTRDIEFAGSKIITEHDYFRGREGYSKWIIQDLHEHTKDLPGSHVLIIHPDGYIQKPEAWLDEFLDYDMIGAKWLYHDSMVCGNGGFSLRSKRFIEICSKLDIDVFHPEDEILGRRIRPFLEKEHGIKFAPAEICDRFSIEAYGCSVMVDGTGFAANQYCGSWGFHGYNVKGLPIPPKPVHRQILKPVIPPRAATLRNRQTRFK